uniref:Uncharacterized protein n=1 Tax=Oryza sativa subsp. japonica TaxID=39947 RepID=Q6Z325_ORYSJ|nr:hypothetical protein [Oryza sativa Japonica Group]BAD17305.1 hypothetical protein [Oryza sativa Japonica Group]
MWQLPILGKVDVNLISEAASLPAEMRGCFLREGKKKKLVSTCRTHSKGLLYKKAFAVVQRKIDAF